MLFMVSNIFPIDQNTTSPQNGHLCPNRGVKVENNHIAEQLQSLEDENANLKRQVELQKAACCEKRRREIFWLCVSRMLYICTLWTYVPSGKRLHNYGKSPFLMGKSTISMAIFNSYVSHYQRVCSDFFPRFPALRSLLTGRCLMLHTWT